eukprot:comp22516_c0_seq1/m.56488 comp22516_c0_seq1/g.56488  ORF comp22516_c0_seq1/g.56488 comp22516_c0_seq1/m.56488 type:complete len:574 (+) comp22516_c0_seq1:2741-4462(+)
MDVCGHGVEPVWLEQLVHKIRQRIRLAEKLRRCRQQRLEIVVENDARKERAELHQNAADELGERHRGPKHHVHHAVAGLGVCSTPCTAKPETRHCIAVQVDISAARTSARLLRLMRMLRLGLMLGLAAKLGGEIGIAAAAEPRAIGGCLGLADGLCEERGRRGRRSNGKRSMAELLALVAVLDGELEASPHPREQVNDVSFHGFGGVQEMQHEKGNAVEIRLLQQRMDHEPQRNAQESTGAQALLFGGCVVEIGELAFLDELEVRKQLEHLDCEIIVDPVAAGMDAQGLDELHRLVHGEHARVEHELLEMEQEMHEIVGHVRQLRAWERLALALEHCDQIKVHGGHDQARIHALLLAIDLCARRSALNMLPSVLAARQPKEETVRDDVDDHAADHKQRIGNMLVDPGARWRLAVALQRNEQRVPSHNRKQLLLVLVERMHLELDFLEHLDPRVDGRKSEQAQCRAKPARVAEEIGRLGELKTVSKRECRPEQRGDPRARRRASHRGISRGHGACVAGLRRAICVVPTAAADIKVRTTDRRRGIGRRHAGRGCGSSGCSCLGLGLDMGVGVGVG